MANYVVWMDGEKATVYDLKPGKIDSTHVEKAVHKHHTSSDANKHKGEDHYFHEIALKLSGAKEILIVGPGQAKVQFKHHLENHHHANLAKAVVGVETVDHPTENQILATARKFFKNYDLFNS